MEKSNIKRVDLRTLIDALKCCTQEDNICNGCPLYESSWICADIIKQSSLAYLQILWDKNEEDNRELLRKTKERDMVKTVTTAAVMPYHQQAQEISEHPKAPAVCPLPSHWIWTDDGVINPDNVLYMRLEGDRTKVRVMDGKLYLDGDPFGIAQRTKPKKPDKDMEED